MSNHKITTPLELSNSMKEQGSKKFTLKTALQLYLENQGVINASHEERIIILEKQIEDLQAGQLAREKFNE